MGHRHIHKSAQQRDDGHEARPVRIAPHGPNERHRRRSRCATLRLVGGGFRSGRPGMSQAPCGLDNAESGVFAGRVAR
jgi:hypothetical protein